jgi:nucleotide-binding universal stress UspA family protein
MFKRIVVGVDGREGGRDALALAALLQRAGGGNLIAVHVYAYDRVVPLDKAGAVEAVLHEDLLTKLEDELRAAGVQARPIVIADPAPARALQALAEREHADVVVIGSCHRAGADRVLAGDVALSTLHGSACAVAVAPRDFAQEPHELRLIGVGYDHSAEAHRALRFASDLARHAGGYVRATTVVPPPAPLWPAIAADPDLLEYDASARRAGDEELLTRAVAEFGERVTGEIAVGKSWRVLASGSGDLDLLVVGSRAYGPLRRVLLGSTSTHLFRAARCPVLVLPRGARTPSDEDACAPAVGASDSR